MWRLCCFLTCKNKGSPQFSLKLPSIRDILRGFQRGNTGQGRASWEVHIEFINWKKNEKNGNSWIGTSVKEADRRNR